jgi:L-ascorbate metabolism protein UlaG (beta-lactamase superfamily)
MLNCLAMDITYLGHSSFKLRGKTASLITDPFDPKVVGLKYPSNEADIVTVSHNHPDHNQSQIIKNVRMVVEGPGEYEISGISIIGIPSFHDNKKGEERGLNTIYVFEIDGLRVAHLGDLGTDLTDEQVTALGSIDVLIIPVGGDYTIGPKDAVKIVGEIDPYFVIPMHYKVSGISSEFSKLEPVDTFLKESGLTVEKMDKFSLKREDILEDQSTKIILLPQK